MAENNGAIGNLWNATDDEKKKPLKGKMLALYARVSQADDDEDIQGQIDDLKEFGDAAVKAKAVKGYDLFVDKAVSGAEEWELRKDGWAMLNKIKDAKKNRWVVVVRDGDRFARSVSERGWAIKEIGRKKAFVLDLDVGKGGRIYTWKQADEWYDTDDETLGNVYATLSERQRVQDIAKSKRGVRQKILLGKYPGVPQQLYDWEAIFADYHSGKHTKEDTEPGRFAWGKANRFMKKWGLHHTTWDRQYERYLKLKDVTADNFEDEFLDWMTLYNDLRRMKGQYGDRDQSKIQLEVRTYSERNLKEPSRDISLLRKPDIPALEAAARNQFPIEASRVPSVF